jgi:hypothetical protein
MQGNTSRNSLGKATGQPLGGDYPLQQDAPCSMFEKWTSCSVAQKQVV